MFNPFIARNVKNSIFEMPIIPQTFNINNLRTTLAKSINLHAISKPIEYSLKNILVKAIFTSTVFKILLFVGRFVLSPAQQGIRSEWVEVSVENKKLFGFC